MCDVGVAAGVLYGLVTVGILTVLVADRDILDVAELLQVDREAAAVLQFNQHLFGSS